MIAISRFEPSVPAELLRQRVAQQPGRVGAAAHLGEQLLPLAPRDAAVLEVGAGVLAAVVEEADVVVLGSSGGSPLDEGVELLQQRSHVVGDPLAHVPSLSVSYVFR